MLKAIIFDLDGTLLNTLEDLWISTNFALGKFNYPQRTLEEVRGFVGNGVRKLIERAVPENCENVEVCLEIFKNHYAENMYNHTAPYNSIELILKELRTHDVRIAVVSNKFDLAVKELCKKYFGDLVNVAIGQFDDVPPKPAPNGVFKAMKQLGVEDALYVGDSDVDVKTAKNANLACIGVTWGFRDRENLKGADFIIDEPCGIIDVWKSFQ
jgi:phosphoglycolate phosphatase